MSTPAEVILYRSSFCDSDGDSHSLLYASAERYTGLSSASLGPLERSTWGKPFFPMHPQLCFSITHSGDWWLCGFSDRALGLDLQVHRSYCAPADLSERFFHPLEHCYLLQDSHRKFYDLWCAKESWVKYSGHGFFDDPDSFSVVSPDGRFPSMQGVHFQILPFMPEYSLCLCTQAPSSVAFRSL